ncbi:hypothetical protein EJ03DRAFT_45698 [Teratosphaeria nubilosa]|uniref:Uncharacterized protein n=1 Tax=Teratosphaeria nubilosa TaxID=161662 RepID=A0A6G1LE31_9PEZI|nr:hypothetical protein EJ03DRAFT_45698 [Teratosphaeria nubilosa]
MTLHSVVGASVGLPKIALALYGRGARADNPAVTREKGEGHLAHCIKPRSVRNCKLYKSSVGSPTSSRAADYSGIAVTGRC